MTGIIGVDPGASGALALLSLGDFLLDVVDMPAHDGVVSGALIADVVDDWRLRCETLHAYVEKVHAMPKQGVASTFRFGHATGVVEGALAALGVTLHHVTPAKWKGDAGVTADKSSSRRRAVELWPAESSRFARVKDDGRAEAALIARYGLGRLLRATP